MKILRLEINVCADCPYCDFEESDNITKEGYYCCHPALTMDIDGFIGITCVNSVPEWCVLTDNSEGPRENEL